VIFEKRPSQLFEHSNFQCIQQYFNSGPCAIKLSGITVAAKPAFLAILQSLLKKPICFLSASKLDLEQVRNSTSFYHRVISGRKSEGVASFPAIEPSPFSGLPTHPETLRNRAVTLWEIYHRRVDILICAPGALVNRISNVGQYFGQVPLIEVGKKIDPDEMTSYLKHAGYFEEEPVTNVGSFSRRGGILDVFSPARENPARIELFGDEIESLREFSVTSQRSIGSVSRILPIPMRETLFKPEDLKVWIKKAKERWGSDRFDEFFENIAFQVNNGGTFQGNGNLLPLVIPRRNSFLDFISDFTVVLDEPEELDEWWASWKNKMEEDRVQLDDQDIPSFEVLEVFEDFPQIKERLAVRKSIRLEQLGANTSTALVPGVQDLGATSDLLSRQNLGENSSGVTSNINFQTAPVRKYHGNIKSLIKDVKQFLSIGSQIVVVQSTTGKAERLKEIFLEYDLQISSGLGLNEFGNNPEQASIIIETGQIIEGFHYVDRNLVVIGERDIYDEIDFLERSSESKWRSGTFVSDFRELKAGDYLVHLDHGIGCYMGLKEIKQGNLTQEFMVLHYQNESKLYVPLERLDLIQKYSGDVKHKPSLDKLGNSSWKKIKARARKAMRDMAQDLLKLYAKRKILPGYSFSISGHWHNEFDEAFEFSETADQIAAIKDINRDMELSTPMDRLLCGDVGFGKTEVAMRAAFKAVFDGKQVAVLAPTTILVFQHYLVFKQRFNAFPITIEMLSRFRRPKEQAAIFERLTNGKIDILIGTHLILSKKTGFRDLGLLIIDEEQRFGVSHKEKLKNLKQNVDTLAMTATPIPRTLHMSLLGIRDMSIIETPPRDRLAIQTNVIPFSKQIIHNAISTELKRDGQVYFVHNKVESIYSISRMLQEICPDSRILVAHGQMNEQDLELTMLKFVEHKADILVSTTIIENGLDVPLVNTLIVNQADQFGLAQLYQLRGRIGRSNRPAYAYLLVPKDKVVSSIARQRLSALKEFSELGSGFKIAALDLEFRGAGNLLGGQQHGHINNVGFDLYCQMLERAIKEAQGEEFLPEIQTQINLKIRIKIPPGYIPDENQRLSIYKRVSSIVGQSEINSLRDELEDRFGPVPNELEQLINYTRLRHLAEKALVQSIEKTKEGIIIKFNDKTPIRPQKLVEIVSSYPGLSLSPRGYLTLYSDSITQEDMLNSVRVILNDLIS